MTDFKDDTQGPKSSSSVCLDAKSRGGRNRQERNSLCLNVHPFDRRRFLVTGAASLVGAGTLLVNSDAYGDHALQRFDGRKMVFASWGGTYQESERLAFSVPFSKKTAATVIQDNPVNGAKLRTMVQSGNVIWDVVDGSIALLYSLGKAGQLEKIDTDVVHTERISPEFLDAFGVGKSVGAICLTYSTADFSGKVHPTTWEDLFDLKRFPGKRMFQNRPLATLEVALLADGVPQSELYPLDVDRAFAKLDSIKDSIVFFKTMGQAQQLITDGGVSCGYIYASRAFQAVKKGAKIGVSWDQNIRLLTPWIVPKGTKNYDMAMGLIDEMTLPENQAVHANTNAAGPTNLETIPMIKEDVRPWLATEPKNFEKGLDADGGYWGPNAESLTKRWYLWALG